MGAAMSVAKNVASNTCTTPPIASGTVLKNPSTSATANGTNTTNGDRAVDPAQEVGSSGELTVAAEEMQVGQLKSPASSEGPASRRKSSFVFNIGNQRQSPERKNLGDRRISGAGGAPASERRASAVVAPSVLDAISGDIAEKQRGRKKSSENFSD